MKLCALDYGKARIGCALSDAGKKIAFPKDFIPTKKTQVLTAAAVWETLKTHGPLEAIILGLPLFMNGKESPMSQEVRAFAKLLEDLSGLRVIFVDERLTTSMGERFLDETGVSLKKRKQQVDGISATILLQNYLDRSAPL